MRNFDRQGLEAFIRSGKKSPPPVFAGREPVIRDIEDKEFRSRHTARGRDHVAELLSLIG